MAPSTGRVSGLDHSLTGEGGATRQIWQRKRREIQARLARIGTHKHHQWQKAHQVARIAALVVGR